MFNDGVPEITRGKDSALDNCLVCLAANMKSRNRGDGGTRTATETGQGLSLDFLFASQHSKNATNPEQMRINNYMGVHGETCYLLLCDHATERLDGVCRQSKAPPTAWLKEVAHKECERRCERLMHLHGSGRRVVQVQGN